MMNAGADIVALNIVRRHLSRVKGGRLAAACAGDTITLAISDVVGDDLSAIGSGPGVPDRTTWADVADALGQWGGHQAHADGVMDVVRRGLAGDVPDTPKPGDSSCSRVQARVVGSRLTAMAGAKAAAEQRGYHPIVIAEPVVGEARQVAGEWLAHARQLAATGPALVCVISAGETTVRVTGKGKGGRNLEFALALVQPMASLGGRAAAASVGTDGIDGSSGVAGAVVDGTSLARSRLLGLAPPHDYLDTNDSFAFFAPLGDEIRLGRTDTNVGDLQVLLLGPDEQEKERF
jgi:hydroxypyruvate reductase